jgi:hypothetical protein
LAAVAVTFAWATGLRVRLSSTVPFTWSNVWELHLAASTMAAMTAAIVLACS